MTSLNSDDTRCSPSAESWTGFSSLAALTGANCQQSVVGIPPPAGIAIRTGVADAAGTVAISLSGGAREEADDAEPWTLALSFPANTSTRYHTRLLRPTPPTREQ